MRRRLYSGLRDETGRRRKASAMVFAPHPDDETLGCGGTLILKRRAGTPVTLVFMADGSTSHRRFMDEKELRLLRREEAANAAAVIGISREEVHFLDFAEGRLGRFQAPAVMRAAALLDRSRPEEIYVPYRADGLPDHEVTHDVVVEAAARAGRPVEICEYPVWAWNQWPWVPFRIRCNRDAVRTLWRMLTAGFGLRLIRGFRSGVFVGDLLEMKREALAQHRSQMTVLRPGTAWPTLPDIAGGAFLQCFFQEFEIFRCRRMGRPGGKREPMEPPRENSIPEKPRQGDKGPRKTG